MTAHLLVLLVTYTQTLVITYAMFGLLVTCYVMTAKTGIQTAKIADNNELYEICKKNHKSWAYLTIFVILVSNYVVRVAGSSDNIAFAHGILRTFHIFSASIFVVSVAGALVCTGEKKPKTHKIFVTVSKFALVATVISGIIFTHIMGETKIISSLATY